MRYCRDVKKLDYNSEFSSRSSSPSGTQDEPELYGECSECKRKRNAVAWCDNCDKTIFKENFYSWTSGNSKIDEFIRHTQLKANENMDYLEWIEFDQFDLVENINKHGAFSSIYSAVWMEGPRWNLDEEAEVWNRNGPIKVILKRLDNSQNVSQEFINQLYKYYKCLQNGALADCFGITKDPTSCYMFVIRYYKNGDLYSYLDETMGILCWRDIVDMLWSISAGLHIIHEHNLVHGHLHGGNVLVENEMDSIDTKITDTGLHGPFDKQISSQQRYGVIPFIAPEVFNGNTLTKESDIYSFGMIMWMLSAGVRPYNNKSHDSQLIQEICLGLRPNIVSGTPPVFARLMLQCLDANPSNRPTASQIYEILGNWVTAICDDPDPSDLSNQFDVAEETKFANLNKLKFNFAPCHENAIYFSRPIDSIINNESPTPFFYGKM
ncbi:kinase-like domain-containing protein [Rhizophagus clarus]|uniref:Kinase-like domain-containing protein n=2 Tax=Rhizophagus clarus TaxID=94130 RepID=A0A8H3M0I7_9GLOM|nr:kinase-like domain-containing protein [Rhizophagus clarus]